MKITQMVTGGYEAIRDLCVPPLCMMCEAILAEPGGCCSSCWSSIRFITKPYCEITGAPFGHDLGEGMLSADAIANPLPYSRCRSAVIYDENIRSLVTGFKYSDRLDLTPWLANWMITAGHELFEQNPVIIPVPLYPLRLIGRRYNQSSELARHIGKQTGLNFRPDILIRHRRTKQQVGLGSKERERNVQGAFRVKDEMKPELLSRNVLIIDDVYTSGATVKAAARALMRGGSTNIDVLTFARVETVE